MTPIPYTRATVNPLRAASVTLLLALLAASGPAGAADDAEAERKLQALKSRIAAIERDQRRDAERRDAESKALRGAETAVARQAQALEDTRRERSVVAGRRDALEARRAETAAGLGADTEALATELRAAWMTGGEPRLRLLLSQEDAGEMGRMLTWYGYLARERAGRIVLLRERLAELAELGRELEAENARLAAVERRQAEAVNALETARAERARRRRRAGFGPGAAGPGGRAPAGRRRGPGKADRKLRAAVADLPMPSEAGPFPAQRGRLSWPAEGTMLRNFGERRGEGPKSNGVLIGAERGAEVRAVWHGRVAYADWLPGLGLLLILEHGDGYLSLYGHNEVLFSAVGDWVAAGQVIGRAGDSGGRDRAGLYFEIRNGARPVDPNGWFARRLTRTN
jgi:murein hydrolase activator